MWLISLIFACSLFIIVCIYKLHKQEHFVEVTHTLRRAPWSLVPFMLSMFIIVAGLDHNGYTKILASVLSSDAPVFVYGPISALACNIVNNIPMSVLFGSVLGFAHSTPAAYACIIGSNVGAFLTPVGALAGIMWSNILRAQKIKLGVGKFILYGTVIAIPTLFASLAGLAIIL